MVPGKGNRTQDILIEDQCATGKPRTAEHAAKDPTRVLLVRGFDRAPLGGCVGSQVHGVGERARVGAWPGFALGLFGNPCPLRQPGQAERTPEQPARVFFVFRLDHAPLDGCRGFGPNGVGKRSFVHRFPAEVLSDPAAGRIRLGVHADIFNVVLWIRVSSITRVFLEHRYNKQGIGIGILCKGIKYSGVFHR